MSPMVPEKAESAPQKPWENLDGASPKMIPRSHEVLKHGLPSGYVKIAIENDHL